MHREVRWSAPYSSMFCATLAGRMRCVREAHSDCEPKHELSNRLAQNVVVLASNICYNDVYKAPDVESQVLRAALGRYEMPGHILSGQVLFYPRM